MSYLFPVEQPYVNAASRTAYAGDMGTDIGLPVGVPIVAVGSGVIVYSEEGHTPWDTPPDTAFSVKIKLDVPIERDGRLYPYVFYTHLSRLVPRAPGSPIAAGERIGYSGIGNRVPHLHITFSENLSITKYLGPFASQNMMWNQWLPAQLDRSTIEGEGDMALVSKYSRRGIQILGADNATDDDKIEVHYRKGGSAKSLVKIWAYPLAPTGSPKEIGEELVDDNLLRIVPIDHAKMPGPFAIQVTHKTQGLRRAPVWAAGFKK